MKYAEKLKDPRWQKKRLEVFDRDNWTCKHCGDQSTTLNVHHLEYKGEPWSVGSDKLITLCEHCHLVIEYIKTKEFNDPLKIFKYVDKDFAWIYSLHIANSGQGLLLMLFEYHTESEAFNFIGAVPPNVFKGISNEFSSKIDSLNSVDMIK